VSTPIEERNRRICERYLEEGETAQDIAIDVGLSVMAVRVILKKGNALRGKTPRVKKPKEEKVLSPLHSKIGGMLSHHRFFTRGIDRKKAAEELNWSMQRVATVEAGSYNLTLTDLQDLSRFLGRPIEEIVNGQSPAKHAKGNRSNSELEFASACARERDPRQGPKTDHQDPHET
jgi:transcriptional regulator with XRE-family HTH domain